MVRTERKFVNNSESASEVKPVKIVYDGSRRKSAVGSDPTG